MPRTIPLCAVALPLLQARSMWNRAHAQSATATAAEAPPNPRPTMSTALPTIPGAAPLSHTLSLWRLRHSAPDRSEKKDNRTKSIGKNRASPSTPVEGCECKEFSTGWGVHGARAPATDTSACKMGAPEGDVRDRQSAAGPEHRQQRIVQ